MARRRLNYQNHCDRENSSVYKLSTFVVHVGDPSVELMVGVCMRIVI